MLPTPPDKCPLCDSEWWNHNEHNNAYCGHCERDWADMEDFHHTGFFVSVDGEPAHILGDPNMSDETMDALAKLIRATRKAVEDETLPGMKNYKPRPKEE